MQKAYFENDTYNYVEKFEIKKIGLIININLFISSLGDCFISFMPVITKPFHFTLIMVWETLK